MILRRLWDLNRILTIELCTRFKIICVCGVCSQLVLDTYTIQNISESLTISHLQFVYIRVNGSLFKIPTNNKICHHLSDLSPSNHLKIVEAIGLAPENVVYIFIF